MISTYASALSAARDAACGQHYPSGALYVVATPIGNLADITLRALHVLNIAQTIACEDTRHTQALLRAYGIDKTASQLLAVHQHNEAEAALSVMDRLRLGERVAYASDAGTPAISDPGLDNWALYFFGSYGLGAAAWWASGRKQLAAWLGVIATVAIAALVVDFRLRIALALAVALALGFGHRSGVLEKWPNARPIAFLGQISYSVFLVHFPIYLLANALFVQLGWSSPGAAILVIFGAWTASIAVGTLFYRWVESPAASQRIGAALAWPFAKILATARKVPGLATLLARRA